jgi:uncharacterized membrane protein YesL
MSSLKTIIFAALVIASQAKRNLDTYTFEQFVSEFKHNWKGSDLVERKVSYFYYIYLINLIIYLNLFILI